MSVKPLLPRNYITTRAIRDAKREVYVVHIKSHGGKAMAAFNGSLNNPRNRKRPITLPKV